MSHAPTMLRCEYLTNPLINRGIPPRFSWRLPIGCGVQSAYHLVVHRVGDETEPIWDTGRVDGDASVHVRYAGPALSADTDHRWRVRIWTEEGPSDRSEPARFSTAPADDQWRGAWIGLRHDAAINPATHLRQTITIDRPVTRARLHLAGRGMARPMLDGQRIGDEELSPGWTDFTKRIQFETWDITDRLTTGEHALGILLGDGWYASPLMRFDGYGEHPSVLGLLTVRYADGEEAAWHTDGTWRAATGPIRYSQIYKGERYDARCAIADWAMVGFDDSDWQAPDVFDATEARLVPRIAEPVRPIEELPVRAVTEPTAGVYVFDLGQNMVGRPRVRLRAPAGTEVRIRFAEMRQSDGMLYTANYRSAESTDYYICGDAAEEVYEPTFTFHGFRYVELTGLPEPPDSQDVVGVVLHNDMAETGTFACDDDLTNRLQSCIRWGLKGNFLEVPTDCPQRDERLGWTGDAQVFVHTACFNMNVAAFFSKWMFDLVDAQRGDGAFPHVAPNVLGDDWAGATAWGDAGVICPWTIYQCYGDQRILEDHFDAMRRWIDCYEIHSRGNDLVYEKFAFGDWLATDAATPGRAPTPRMVIASAYFSHCCRIMTCVAEVIDRGDEAARFAALHEEVKASFNRNFVTETGYVVGHTQTGYLLALGFDLLPEALRPVALRHLVNDIAEHDDHLATGFVGTPLLCPVLTRFGRLDLAYRLLHRTTYPSWLCPIVDGDATTMWERWNSYSSAHGFGDAGMNSFNHYAYGAIGAWLYNTVAGIDLDPEQPGYKHILIHPQPDPRPEASIHRVDASLDSMYGRIRSAWRRAEGRFDLNVTIPPNTTATVTTPDGEVTPDVPPGEHHFNAAL